MRHTKTPPAELLVGRRALEGLAGYELLEDLRWDQQVGRWVLHCRLAAEVDQRGLVPTRTNWYLLIDGTYPWGEIDFYPDQEHSLVHTFPHQRNNRISTEHLWRLGNICVSTSLRFFARRGYDQEPHGPAERLEWNVRRAQEWLKTASRDQLFQPGDPFELPEFPLDTTATLAFSEGPETYVTWQGIPDQCGTVLLRTLSSSPDVRVVHEFRSLRGAPLVSPSLGQGVRSRALKESHGIWLRLGTPPVLPPWQAPLTWAELREAASLHGGNIDDLLATAFGVAWKERPRIALVGFPIPARVGEVPSRMHWTAVSLPSAPGALLKGFRPDSPRQRMVAHSFLFRDSAEISWANAENWDEEEIATRGRLPRPLRDRTVLLLGAGAIGSVVGELLVRAGVHRLVVMDDDRLHVGNLTRHTLGLDHLLDPKSEALADRLNAASPHAEVSALHEPFPPTSGADQIKISGCDLVIDATGSDEALFEISRYGWEEGTLFASISLGLGASRLFCFTSTRAADLEAEFRQAVQPWLELEGREYNDRELPREGIGCWHPVFPARADDVWLLGAASVKVVEDFVQRPDAESTLAVFEQVRESRGFAGLRRIEG